MRHFLERVMGIEPTRPAWKAGILPLNYTRVFSWQSQNCLNMIPQTYLFVNSFFEKIKIFFSHFEHCTKNKFLTEKQIIEKYYCNKDKNVVLYIEYEKMC